MRQRLIYILVGSSNLLPPLACNPSRLFNYHSFIIHTL